MSNPLLDSLAAGFGGTDAARRGALDAALRAGLPGPRDEAWKYTPLRALERRSFAAVADGEPAAAIEPALLAAIPAPRLVFVNGRLDDALTDLAGLPGAITLSSGGDPAHASATPAPASQVFRQLNAALARDGMLLRVDGDAGKTPLQLVSIGAPAAADLAWHLRHRIDVSAGAVLVLVEHHLDAGAHRHLDTARLALQVGAGARVVHARVQARDAGATTLLHTDASLADHADYRRIDLELGAALSRHELEVHLAGAGAAIAANGVLLAGGRRHLDTRLGIRHGARDTASTLRWRGIGAGRGRAVFHGGITIDAGADGSNADLSNRNLLLSADAEVDAPPVLVIHADEVKAAHGATVGQLDPSALFYLRSRGIPADAARRLLTAAFVRETLSVLDDDALRAPLQAALEGALAALDPA